MVAGGPCRLKTGPLVLPDDDSRKQFAFGHAAMKTLIVGAGPAGLYLAYLLRRQSPHDSIRVVEQNARDSTFGFGVVFSDRALEFLRDDDAETHALIAPALETWSDMTLCHRGERITIDGVGFAAIGRLRLLQLMQQRLASVGIEPEYRHTVAMPPSSRATTSSSPPMARTPSCGAASRPSSAPASSRCRTTSSGTARRSASRP